MNLLKVGPVAPAAMVMSGAVIARESQADRLRGVVLMMDDGDWVPIARGDVIEDSRIIRTGANGKVTFRSGEQIVEMRPDSQIQISAQEGRDYTWILHAVGEITADVEARDVEHFGVRTHHMVAVVKGTRFTVLAGDEGASVAVERGTVAVSENEDGLSVAVNSGQRATGGSGRLVVEGEGELPQVLDTLGRPVMTAPPAFAQSLANAPGSSPVSSPGNAANAPGRSGVAPGNSGNAPGQTNAAPGNSANAPGNSANAPGNSGNGPGQSNAAPGLSGDAPGRSAAPGNSGSAPGASRSAPGRSGSTPANSSNAAERPAGASDTATSRRPGTPASSASAGSSAGNANAARPDNSANRGNGNGRN